MGLDEDVASYFRVERQEYRFGGDERRALNHGPSAQPVLQRGLRGGKLRPVVDAYHLLPVGDQGAGDEAPRAGDLHDVGEVILVLGVVGLDRVQEVQRFGSAEGDWAGVAQARSPFFGVCVLVLADRRNSSVALDQSAVASRIGGLKPERRHIRALGQLGEQRRERGGRDERDIGIEDENIVIAPRDLAPRRQNGVGSPLPRRAE